MKYLNYLIFFIINIQSLFSQSSIENIKYNFKAANNYNVLYKGITNILELNFDTLQPEKIIITSDSKIIDGDSGKYKFIPNIIGNNNIAFNLTFEYSNGYKIHGYKVFDIIDTNIVPIVSNKAERFLSKSELNKDPYISVIKNDSVLNDVEVISFSISTYNQCLENYPYWRENIKGNKITDPAFHLLTVCTQSFQKINIESITAKDTKGNLIDLPPIVFYLY